jgi:hypothetical protein
VITMGVLIIVGSVVLVVGLVNQLGDAENKGRPAPVDIARARVMHLGLPKEAIVRRMVAEGDRLILHISIPGSGNPAGDWIYVVPLGGGQLLKISLTGKAGAAK